MLTMVSSFSPIEKVVQAFIKDRYPAIGSRVGRDAQYVLGQDAYIQVHQSPGGGTNHLRGEWAVDISVHDDNYLNAVRIAGELEALLVGPIGRADYEGMIIDDIVQNQAPSSRPTNDKRVFEVGAIYVFSARRRS